MAKLVGEQTLSNGDTGEGAIARTGEEVVSQLHAPLYEQGKRGRVFNGMTAVTGVAPGTAIGTTAGFALYNPRGSGVDLVVLTARLAYVSGTLGAGVISWVGHLDPAQAAITGTAIPSVAARMAPTASVSAKGKPLTTATVPASGTPMRPFGSLQASLATTAVSPWALKDDVDGAIIVQPGCAVSLQGTTAAGTSPLVVYGVSWEEVPV